MGDLSYPRKYRPKTFKECVGDEKAIQLVMQTLKGEHRPQVILLKGPAGCGKTTIARLIAKEYCCTHRDKETGACETCANCKAFSEYIETGENSSLMNLQEFDCSNMGKKEADDLKNNMETPTLDGGWRIFILDEAHLMTTQAMGTLLKCMEEPDSKRLIILCTTNPERLLNTIVSRCDLQLEVAKQTQQKLMQLLAYVCKKENVTYEDKALAIIATRSDYEPRQALKMLQSVVSSVKDVTYKNTLNILHITTDDVYYNFFRLCTLKEPEPAAFLQYMAKIKMSMEFKVFFDGLLAYIIRGLYIYNGVQITGVDAAEIKEYGRLFKRYTVQEIAYVLRQFIDAKNSQDLELRFIMWGYNGIFTQEQKASDVNLQTPSKVNLQSDTAQMESNIGVQALNKAKESTPSDLANLVQPQAIEMQTKDVLGLFKGAAIVKK